MKNSNKFLLSFCMIATILSLGMNKSPSQVTDIDGNTYKTVIIGTQEWMAENLNVGHYRNGDTIPQKQDILFWDNFTKGAWCYFDDNQKNGKIYGKLYNWYTVNDPRGLAPEGWHIPTDEEWTKLTYYLGGEAKAGGKLKAITLWDSTSTETTNESGFSALPGGCRDNNGSFDKVGKGGCFWTSSGYGDDFAWNRYLYFDYSGVSRGVYFKLDGWSCRCVKV